MVKVVVKVNADLVLEILHVNKLANFHVERLSNCVKGAKRWVYLAAFDPTDLINRDVSIISQVLLGKVILGSDSFKMFPELY